MAEPGHHSSSQCGLCQQPQLLKDVPRRSGTGVSGICSLLQLLRRARGQGPGPSPQDLPFTLVMKPHRILRAPLLDSPLPPGLRAEEGAPEPRQVQALRPPPSHPLFPCSLTCSFLQPYRVTSVFSGSAVPLTRLFPTPGQALPFPIVSFHVERAASSRKPS